MNKNLYIFISVFLCLFTNASAQKGINTDVLIIGGGASGVTAAIQSSRLGAKTLVIEETNWLGGMLTSAGVSAIDGNHQLPSGLWGEFREELYKYYGGPAAVETGWVSNTLFEPSVGNQLLKKMASEIPLLDIWYQSRFESIQKDSTGWLVKVRKGKNLQVVHARVLIDATELGDVMAACGARYDIGMDSRLVSGEIQAPEKANDIIQDLTYVVILKDFGKGADKTIRKPAGYDPELFKHCCDVADPAAIDATPLIDCSKMITYGKLPNGKYMINWPKDGNDIYLNIIEKSDAERKKALEEAKLHTLRFLYYMQTELGFKYLGIADEFPTKDKLPMIPYHRESRRVHGLVRLTLPYVSQPYDQENAFYRTGVIVGDYTIDHHHLKNPDAPKIDFVKIKVPSYNVPLGALVPKDLDGLIVAEKSISVSNIVAGATRLQPVVLGIGQAAGALAAVAVKKDIQPKDVNIRDVQQLLLDGKAYLLPFIDVKPENASFQAIQRIGATGILRGTGISYKWANQTWFYPNHPISEYEMVQGLKTYYPVIDHIQGSGKDMDAKFFADLIHMINASTPINSVLQYLKKEDAQTLTREEVALAIDRFLNPFQTPIDFNGNLLK
ncbi:FAD-dependent oxidoreductase [Arcticibacter sp.]|uniref:FAD-dependent oxidoreductase n=1 Tax=Arcticibacter sp. TaxID=1872630 RepID=UPI00388DAFDA